MYRSSLTNLTLAAVVLCLSITGCQDVDPTAGYTSKSLHRSDVDTVFVEMFRSQSFRRGVEFELTRAVAQQVEIHTPFKVVSDRRQADTILYGTINNISEAGLSRQSDVDRPIENQVTLRVELNWKDLRSGEPILDRKRIRVTGPYTPLLGATRSDAANQAANDIAVRIVEAMEIPW